MNIGTIGTGQIVEKILTSIGKTRHLKCSAVYSRAKEKGQALAKRFGIPRSLHRYGGIFKCSGY